MTYTFVTVVFKTDYSLARLQARSLARYLSADFADEIYVIANQGLNGCDEWQQPMLRDYGPLVDKVRFLDAGHVATVPANITGWQSQQILKLMVARFVSSDRYVVLDAKNHLLFPLSSEFFENGEKIRLPCIDYENHEMRQHLDNSLRYFGVCDHDIVRTFFPTTTPFVFPTRIVKDLLVHVTRRERLSFAAAFDSLGTTEFLLFGGFLRAQSGGIPHFYDMSGPHCPVIWPETAIHGYAAVKRVTARVEDKGLPFFTVHRYALPLLDDESKEAVAALWVRRQLFENIEDALVFVGNVCSLLPAKKIEEVVDIIVRRKPY
jgi:hypothetical protein